MMGMWDDHARRLELVLGRAMNRTDHWGRYIPEPGDEDDVALPPMPASS